MTKLSETFTQIFIIIFYLFIYLFIYLLVFIISDIDFTFFIVVAVHIDKFSKASALKILMTDHLHYI